MMRTRLTGRVGFLAALIGAACNGRLSVLDEPVGTGADDLTASGNGGNISSGCDLEQWRPGESDTPRPIDCGVCSCVGDELVCDERPCLSERTIVECTDDPYRFETTLAAGSGIQGDEFHVRVMGPGGCGNEDYVACYIALDLAINPLGGFGFRVLASPEAAACDSVMFQTFDVDLTPLASLLEPGSGLIDIGNEYLIFGELSCADYQALAHREVSQTNNEQGAECEMDSDCVGVWGYTSCIPNGCLYMATNTEDTVGLRETLQSIDETRCKPFFDAGCASPWGPTCDDSNPPRAYCWSGRCESSP